MGGSAPDGSPLNSDPRSSWSGLRNYFLLLPVTLRTSFGLRFEQPDILLAPKQFVADKNARIHQIAKILHETLIRKSGPMQARWALVCGRPKRGIPRKVCSSLLAGSLCSQVWSKE